MVVTAEHSPEQENLLQCELENYQTIHRDVVWRAKKYTFDNKSAWDVFINMHEPDSDIASFSGISKHYTELGAGNGPGQFGEFTTDVNNNKENLCSCMDVNISTDHPFTTSSHGLEASFDEATGETRVKIGDHEYPIDRSSFLTDVDACPQAAPLYASPNRLTHPEVSSGNELFELARDLSPFTLHLAKDGQIHKDDRVQTDFKHIQDYRNAGEPVLEIPEVHHPLSFTECRFGTTVPAKQRAAVHAARTVNVKHRTMSGQAIQNVGEPVIADKSSPMRCHQGRYSIQSVGESVIGDKSSPMRCHQGRYSIQSVGEPVIGDNSSPMRCHEDSYSIQNLVEPVLGDKSSPVHRHLRRYTTSNIDRHDRDKCWTQSEYHGPSCYENHTHRVEDITDVLLPNVAEQWISSLSISSSSNDDCPPSCSSPYESQREHYDKLIEDNMQFGTHNCAMPATWTELTVAKPQATVVSSFCSSRYCEDLPQQESLLRSSQQFTKKKTWKRGCRLWEYIRNLLLDPITNPSLIKWENRNEGTFRLVQNKEIAHIWGMKKGNEEMSYDKLSRAMRYYYKKEIFQPVIGKRLVYRFGPRATGWKEQTIN